MPHNAPRGRLVGRLSCGVRMPKAVRGEFEHQGFRLAYEVFGEGPRPFVLLPGLLLPRTMHAQVAEALAEQGNQVICLDLLGHGESDRPEDMTLYSMGKFAEQTVALLDHLDLDEAVVGGTSLGANVTLEAAVLAPERMRGLVVEMPVLDNALVACALAFSPLLVYLTLGRPVARVVAAAFRRVPRGLWHWTDVGLDWISQDPRPSGAVLQGLFFGRIAPPSSERTRIEAPALVFGHPRDPIHPFNDADTLVRELPNGRLVEATSMIEFRLTPDRLLGEVARFLDECWRPAEARTPAGEPLAGRGRSASA
jgi:pimeloyl-ACP methyl ester carboxylesterase